MPIFICPNERWGSLDEVVQMYSAEKDAKIKAKLNAIHLLMKGRPRKEVAEILCVCETTIGHWRNQWNQAGKECLRSRKKGRKSMVTDGVRAEITKIVEIEREIDGRTVTGYLIHGYLKKNTD